MSYLKEEEFLKIKSLISDRISSYEDIDDDKMRGLIAGAVSSVMSKEGYGLREKSKAVELVYSRIRGYDILQDLFDDPNVTDIMVNGPYSVFYEKYGKISSYNKKFLDRAHLLDVIHRLFESEGKSISEGHPFADLILKDGSRANAILTSIAPEGPILTIRKFTGIHPDMETLINTGFITTRHADFLIKSVKNKKNIFISGGTGTGKTTFLNVLSAYISTQERVVTVEDTPELNLQSTPNIVRLQTRSFLTDKSGEVSMSDLIKCALRMRPDRIIVGEVRGSEAADMLWAMNSGHMGSLSTGHSNSAPDMLSRLCIMVEETSKLSADIICAQINSAIDIIVHLTRKNDGSRIVDSIIKVIGYSEGKFKYENI